MMKKLLSLLSIALFLILITLPATVQAEKSINYCTCEDWDNDGRFGAVAHKLEINKKVLKSNIGDYGDCASTKSGMSSCSGNIKYCACEDWDKDGRFGVVLYEIKKYKPKVLKSNIGDFYKCTAFKSSSSRCDY
jgi:hypothetical protein